MFSADKVEKSYQALCHSTHKKVSIWGTQNNFMPKRLDFSPQFQKVFSIPRQFFLQQFIPRTFFLQQFILRQFILSWLILRQFILRWFILSQFTLKIEFETLEDYQVQFHLNYVLVLNDECLTCIGWLEGLFVD